VTDAYDTIGVGYGTGRRSDPRWAAAITKALGSARTIVNVGAGTGSYEPADRLVTAVEPSAVMLAQRPPGSPPVVRATAARLPLRRDAAEVAMAILTVHHWNDWRIGLTELRRVAPRQVVLAYDPQLHCEFWLVREYIPEVAALELARPSADDIAHELHARAVTVLPVPWDMTDGVFPAHWRRPEAYLRLPVRRACSALAQTDPAAVARGVAKLRRDLATGRWHRQHEDLLKADEFDAGFRLITAET
jgi:hypothetical protein